MSFNLSSPHSCTQIDAPALEAWERDGVLKITNIIPPDRLAYVRQKITDQLGSVPEDPASWEKLKSSLLKPLGRDSQCVVIDSEPVKNAIDALLGPDWKRPASGGNWFCNAPTQQAPPQSARDLIPRGLWHWDGRPDLQDHRDLWAFSPLADLPPNSGGTWLLAGSHRMVLDFYAELSSEQNQSPSKKVKKWFTAAHPWFRTLNNDEALDQTNQPTEPMTLLNVSGNPGDVVFMKTFTIHSMPAYVGPGPRVCHMITASPSGNCF